MLTLRPGQRLRRPGDFRRVREQGRRINGGAFTLWWCRREPAPLAPAASARVGVVASRAAVGVAVKRNFAKRRLRELFRRNQRLLPRAVDLLLVARPPLNQLEFRELESRFVEACRRIVDQEHAQP